ncbi:MAG: right-handed parallel beta-helix repeat-containing protein, partial [Candidatus Cloacimonetes bacterium]|nr:right-handed parallel beta-helix repeat-containing protein [Candidatus Cloacimonadota bacterium]
MKYFKILLFGLFAVTLNSGLINVPDTGGGIHCIQSGINEAIDGDTVLVAPGTYYENINFLGKKITVASEYLITGDEDDIENTIIDGGGNDAVVRMESGEDTLSYLCGFVIRNGNNPRGGGISIYQSGAKLEHLKIRDNLAESSGAPYGGGLYADGDVYLQGYEQIIIRDTEIIDNSVIGNYAVSGGFKIENRYDLVLLENVTISNNTSDAYYYASCGGGYITGVTNVSLKNCTISNNFSTCPESATIGGMSLSNVVDVQIVNCQIIDNSVEGSWSVGGGLGISATGDVIVRNCLIADNIAEGEVCGIGGMGMYEGDFLFEDCEFRGNEAAGGTGGMAMTENCDVILNRVLFHDNVAEKGAALTIGRADVLLINSVICNNQATLNGGIHFKEPGRFRIVNSIIWNNGAQEFWIDAPTCVQFQHNIIQYGEGEISCSNGGSYFWGEGNMQSYPQFVSIGTDDFHLQSSSPGIDSGVNACEKWGAGPYLIPGEDIIGQNRDIGIYEQGDEDYSFDLPTYLSVDEDVLLNLDLDEYLMGMSGQFSGSCENN